MDSRTAPRGEMDHSTIQESQVPDRYLMGKLSAEERVAFEEHYLDCPVCLEYLESVEGLRAGLKELSPAAAATGPKSRAIVRFPDRRLVLLLAAACLAVGALPSALFFGKYRSTSGQLASARTAIDDAQRKNDALTRSLESQRAAGADAAAEPLAASVFTLSLTRGIGEDAPSNRIALRNPREWVIVLLDRPESPKPGAYQARVSTADGRPVGGPLTASAASNDMLAVGMAPGLLSDGDYVLTLEDVGSAAPRELAAYRFRVGQTK